MTNKDWLQELKVGDPVIVGGSHRRTVEGEVKRFTKTQILVKVGNSTFRFSRATGYRIGNYNTFGRDYLIRATPEKLAAVKRGAWLSIVFRRATGTILNHATMEELQQINDILDTISQRKVQ